MPCARPFSTREMWVGESLALTVPPGQRETLSQNKMRRQTTREETLRLSTGITRAQVNLLIYTYLDFHVNTEKMNVIVSLYNIEDLCLKKD